MGLDELAATAVHESGHAVIAAVLGIGVTEVQSGLHVGHVKPWYDEDVDPEDIIVMLLAGAQASFAHGEPSEPARDGGSNDRTMAGRIAYERDPRTTNATMARLHWRTVTLVIEHEAAIAAFANELLIHRRLAGDDLQRALERSFAQSRGGHR